MIELRIRDVAHQPFFAELCEYGTAVDLALQPTPMLT
jgi:hypothetical protein